MEKNPSSVIEVNCSNVGLTLTTKEGYVRRIISKTNAVFKPGKMTAIMGASGAGKTSFLTVLSGDAPRGSTVDGHIYVNNMEVSGSTMKDISAFVFQDDVLMTTMTVQEAIQMAALLGLPESLTYYEKMDRVENTIRILGLEGSRETLIGTPEKKGISGGERKRTCVGMELVSNPYVIFLDEPTSGIDTYMAHIVIGQLKELTDLGKTVVATIHQPSAKTFGLFDEILLLAAGRVIYHGPVDKMLEYFGKLGFHCPEHSNPAEFLFMEILGGSDSIQVIGNGVSKHERLIAAWEASNEEAEVRAIVTSGKLGKMSSQKLQSLQRDRSHFLTQYLYLTNREILRAWRAPLPVAIRLAFFTFLSFLYGNWLRKETFSFYFSILVIYQLAFMSQHLVATTIEDRPIFLRETKNRYYSVLAYVCSKSTWELLITSIIVLIIYGMSIFRGSLRLTLMQVAILFANGTLASCCGSATSMLVGSMFDNHVLANIANLIFSAAYIATGFYGSILDSLLGDAAFTNAITENASKLSFYHQLWFLRIVAFLSNFVPSKWAFGVLESLQVELTLSLPDSITFKYGFSLLALFGLFAGYMALVYLSLLRRASV